MHDETEVDKWQTRLIGIVLTAIFIMVAWIGFDIAIQPIMIDGIVVFDRQSRGHDDSLRLSTGNLPPVGGSHHSEPQECGIYFTAIEPATASHSMEHGALWITYQPTLPEAEIAYLRDMVRGREYLLLSPFPGQQSPVVLTAWGVQLETHSAHDARVEKFIARYLLGPLTPERGSPCVNRLVTQRP